MSGSPSSTGGFVIPSFTKGQTLPAADLNAGMSLVADAETKAALLAQQVAFHDGLIAALQSQVTTLATTNGTALTTQLNQIQTTLAGLQTSTAAIQAGQAAAASQATALATRVGVLEAAQVPVITPPTPPNAPTITGATAVTTSSITVAALAPVAGPAPNHYTWEIATPSGSGAFVPLAGAGLTVTASGLAGGSYDFRITAWSATAPGGVSAVYSTATAVAPPVITAPLAPTITGASAITTSSFTLTAAAAPTGSPATSYHWEYRTPPSGSASVSPDGTIVTTVGPTITDATGNVFTLTSGAQVAMGGTALGFTSAANTLEYLGGVVWWKNTTNQWWSILVSGGVGSNSPIGPVSTPAGTLARRGWDAVDGIGFNTHLGYSGVSSANLAFIQADLAYLGVHHIRDGGPMTAGFGTLGAAGVKIMFGFQNYPSMASWLADAVAVETAHPGTIAYTEGPNEVDNIPTYAYGGLTSYAAANLAQSDLWNAVAGSSILNGHTKVAAWACAFVANTPNQGVHPTSHYGNIHDYWYPKGTATSPLGPQIATSVSTEQTNVRPGAPVITSETGWSTAQQSADGFGVNYAVQAVLYMHNLLAHLANANILRIYSYELIDDNPDPSNNTRENQYGLFNSANTPKPAAVAIKNFVTLLTDAGGTAKTFAPGSLSYRITGLPGTGSSYVFQLSDGTFLLAIWNEPSVWNASTKSATTVTPVTISVLFSTVYGTIRVFDPIASATATQTLSNASSVPSLSLGANALVIQLSPLAQAVPYTSGATGAALTTTLTGLPAATSFGTRITGSNSAGTGTPSAEFSVSTASGTSPSADGTTAPPASSLIMADGTVVSLVGGQVAGLGGTPGVVDTIGQLTAGVVLIGIFKGGRLYQENNTVPPGWWYLDRTAGYPWVPDTDPTVVTPPPPVGALTLHLGTAGATAVVNLATPGAQVVRASAWGAGSAAMGANYSALTNAAYVTQLAGRQFAGFRHNWGGIGDAGSQMSQIFPTRGSASGAGTFTSIDNFLNTAPTWLPATALHIVTVGFPSWIDVTNGADQTLWASLVVKVAQHFVAKGFPATYWSITNEPDPALATSLGQCCAALRTAMRAYNATYKVGGPSFSFEQGGPEATFATLGNPDFITYHGYWGSGNSIASTVSRATNDARNARAALGQTRSTSEIIQEEHNIDAANFFNPENRNYHGAVQSLCGVVGTILGDPLATGTFWWDLGPDDAYALTNSDGTFAPGAPALSQFAKVIKGGLCPGTLTGWPADLITLFTTNGLLFLNGTNTDQSIQVGLTLPATGTIRKWVASPAAPAGVDTALAEGQALTVPAGGIVTLAPSYGAVTPPPAGTLFHDVFPGSTWDRSKWIGSYFWQTGGGGGANGFAVNPDAPGFSDPSLQMLTVANNQLSCLVRPTPSQFSGLVGGNGWLVSMINTFGKFSRTFGYIEVTAKLIQNPGCLSAIWLYTVSDANNPAMEIDITETASFDPNRMHMTSHPTNVANPQDFRAPTSSAAGFHAYGLDWNANTLTWYYDRQIVSGPFPTPATCKGEMYLLLSTYVNSNGNPADAWWGGPLVSTSQTWPAAMTVSEVSWFATRPF